MASNMGPKISLSASCISSALVGWYSSIIAFAIAILALFRLFFLGAISSVFIILSVLSFRILHLIKKIKCVSLLLVTYTLYFTLPQTGAFKAPVCLLHLKYFYIFF